jgi:hypothetical protein
VSDDDKRQKQIYKGAQAEALVKSGGVFDEACKKLETAYITVWRQTPTKDTEAREKLWMAVNQIEKIRDHLVSMMSDGKVAQKELDRLTAEEERKRTRRAA